MQKHAQVCRRSSKHCGQIRRSSTLEAISLCELFQVIRFRHNLFFTETQDILYSSGDEKLSKGSPLIEELCELLQTLPIHPKEKRPANFRNTVGVSDQIRAFRQEMKGVDRSRWGVGKLFHEVDEEYKTRTDELHEIAEAIRRNQKYFCSCNFGQLEEMGGFPEGALLAHLHKVIEKRDGSRYEKEKRCAICQISFDRIYHGCGDLLKNHLVVPVVKLDSSRRYKPDCFVTVCPNCHEALHRYRPWRTKKNMIEILR